jgi:hypothetical protein
VTDNGQENAIIWTASQSPKTSVRIMNPLRNCESDSVRILSSIHRVSPTAMSTHVMIETARMNKASQMRNQNTAGIEPFQFLRSAAGSFKC